MTPLASNWSTIDTTIDITLYITAVVFVAVNLFMAYAVYKFRHNPERRAHYEPENKKLETWLTVVTSIGVAAMLAPGLLVWADFIDVPDDATEVEAVGLQWQWNFRLPGEDGILGEIDSMHVSEDNPFGMNVNDPTGNDDVLIHTNELHIPVDKPVKLLLRSKDVLHNFAVPQFRVKMDLVPGMVTHAWFTPTRTGKFDVLCMELCGIAHYAMRGYVIVDTQEDYEKWLSEQTTWADIQAIPAGNADAGKANYMVCAGCHGQNGEGNQALNAPKLAGLPDWYVTRQLQHYKQGIRGAHKDDLLGTQMAGMANTLVDDTAIRNVTAYIETLDAAPAANTLGGDATNGASHYVSCGACHGANGQGNVALQAPPLTGQDDWYLKRQLENFRHGVRGAHQEDTYGHQMVLMARSLHDEQAVDDLLAYLNSQ
jgi:cytochrome c oxidase subunit 2